MPIRSSSQIRSATDSDIGALKRLWDICGLTRPYNHAPTDIAFARRGANSDVLVLERGGTIAASVMVGHDGHRGTAYYVAVDPAFRRQGLGAEIMRAAETWLRDRGIWRMNLKVRRSNAAVCEFYQSLGYEELDVLVMGRDLRPTPHIDADAPHGD